MENKIYICWFTHSINPAPILYTSVGRGGDKKILNKIYSPDTWMWPVKHQRSAGHRMNIYIFMCAYVIMKPSWLNLLESESSILWSANIIFYKCFILQLRSGGLVTPKPMTSHQFWWHQNPWLVISFGVTKPPAHPEVGSELRRGYFLLSAYGLDGPEIESRWGRDFPHLSRTALGPIQPPVQWVPGLSRG